MYLQRFWREVFDTWSPWLPGSPPVCAAYTCLSSAPSCISRKPLRWNLCSVWGHCKTVFHIWNLLYLYKTVRNISMKYKRKFVDDRNTRFLVFFLFVFFSFFFFGGGDRTRIPYYTLSPTKMLWFLYHYKKFNLIFFLPQLTLTRKL